MRKALAALFALTLGTMALASGSGTIHEIVSSHCSKDHQGNANPPGQTPAGFDFDQSDLRALLATGVYDDGTVQFLDPGPPPTVRIVPANIDHPASKFSWDGESFTGPIPEDLDGDGSTDILLILPELVPDHPSLENCKNLREGQD